MNDTYGLPSVSKHAASRSHKSGRRHVSSSLYCQRRGGEGSEKLDGPHTIAYNGQCKQPVDETREW